MRQEYYITLHSQLGPRDGTLSIAADGSLLSGTLTLLGFENPVTGRMEGDGTVRRNRHSLPPPPNRPRQLSLPVRLLQLGCHPSGDCLSGNMQHALERRPAQPRRNE